MDRVQKVRSVPHGQIYRPVFDAEEQLIKVSQSYLIINSINQSVISFFKSIKSHKNPLPVLESPEGATLRPVLYLLHNHES